MHPKLVVPVPHLMHEDVGLASCGGHGGLAAKFASKVVRVINKEFASKTSSPSDTLGEVLLVRSVRHHAIYQRDNSVIR